MARLHDNTTFDPEERAVAFVTELEKEALDEAQVAAAIQEHIETLSSRVEASRNILLEERQAQLADRRREKLRAKIKGVKPLEPRKPGDAPRIIQTAQVIPMKAV